MARLLKIIGQEEQAAHIYLKNRDYELAHKAYQMAFVRLIGNGDFKALKLLDWHASFLKDFEYEYATFYSRRAYTTATSKNIKLQAVKAKFNCVEKMKKGPTEEEMRLHQNFMEEGDLTAYTSETSLLRFFKQIRLLLRWDVEGECSVMDEGDVDKMELDSSFWLLSGVAG